MILYSRMCKIGLFIRETLNQEGVMNLGLGTSAGIGERKSEVSGHRDVTNKSVREIPGAGQNTSQIFVYPCSNDI